MNIKGNNMFKKIFRKSSCMSNFKKDITEYIFNAVKQTRCDIENILNRNIKIIPTNASYHQNINIQAYIAKVSRGGHKREKNDKIRVVFLFQEPSYWPSIKTLYENLKNDKRFEVFVVAIPITYPPDLNKLELRDSVINFLKENNIDYINGITVGDNAFDIYTLKPDYVFVQIHFDIQRQLEYKTNILRLYTKVCLVPHAFLLSASDNKELIYQSDYFRIFVPNEFHAKTLAGVLHHDDNIEVTGYPRFDLYQDEIKDSNLWKISKQHNPNIKRIIWSPHWWAYGHSQKLADGVLGLYNYFYKMVKNNPDIELVIKPHPNLFNGLVASGYITNEQKEKLFNDIKSLPNAQIYTGGNYIDLFKTADLIVNNSISFLIEWLPSKKPMIFFDTERKFELNEIAEQIMKVYYHADTIDKLNKTINSLLNSDDTMKKQRLDLIDKLELNQYGAAEKIKESLIKNVDTEY